MSVARNQRQTFLRLIAQLRPHWRRDDNLPARIQALFARHREFGSRDRRLYRELIYTTWRYLPWVEPLLNPESSEEAVRQIAWLAQATPATVAFRQEFAVGAPPQGTLTELLPSWFEPHCPEIFAEPELSIQLRRSPLWLRLPGPTATEVFSEFTARHWRWRPSAVLAGAIEMLDEVDVTASDAWQRGQLEVQDLGSQLILATSEIEAGGHWLDACAGAGGKTLQLAGLLGPSGKIDAHDVRPDALRELERRAHRAGMTVGSSASRGPGGPHGDPRFATVKLVGPLTQAYDGVLIDAPCTGSGTWRRAPHLKWTLSAERVTAAAKIQSTLLQQFSAHVRPGGRLVYATCSLSRQENEDVVLGFLRSHPQFQADTTAPHFELTAREVGWAILPARYDTDGFYVASLRRRQAG